MTPKYSFKRLSEEDDISSFHCGDEPWQLEISNFLNENAYEEQQMGLNVTTLVYSKPKLIAFFCLLAFQIQLKDSEWRKRCGLDTVTYSNIPCILIGQFAVETSMQGQRTGRDLTSWVRGSVLDLDIGVKFLAVHVDMNNEVGRAFWESESFVVYDGIKSRDKLTMLYDLYAKIPNK